MVAIKTRIVGTNKYYYLEHTLRSKGAFVKKVKYLGKRLPKNVEELKGAFLSEIYEEKWYPLFEAIKKRFNEDRKLVPETVLTKELAAFAINFTYDTQRIEGSKLTLRETADLLEKGITPKAKPLEDVKEAEAHRDVFNEALAYGKDLSLQVILYWHKRLFQNTKPEIAGTIRQHRVAISGSRFLPPFPAELMPLLMEFFRWYNKGKTSTHPVELAALAHLKLVTIHPFADGNGRVSRLATNFILHRHGFPMLDIRYENRVSYYNALERSQIKRTDSVFVQWFFRKYFKEYRRYLQK